MITELEKLKIKYEQMQQLYGEKSLSSVSFGGCCTKPEVCFVFMIPTSRNISSSPLWKGIRAPWIGTRSIWDLFMATSLFSVDLYNEIKSRKPNEWNEDFAKKVYDEVAKNCVFITNLGKCTQLDARIISNSVYKNI